MIAPIISCIVAIDAAGAIGYQNQLPWHMPADLKHFKEITYGKPIVMGRKTYESIGKPLPHRENIIITRDKDFTALGCHVYSSIDSALADYAHSPEIMIIGGATIFAELLPKADRLYLTEIDHHFTADTFLPRINYEQWRVIQKTSHTADEKNPYNYTFLTFEKITTHNPT